MDLFFQVLDFFIHIDRHLGALITSYGTWTYLLLFIVVFCETGLVVTPFLPGDSLLFAAGGAHAALPAFFSRGPASRPYRDGGLCTSGQACYG